MAIVLTEIKLWASTRPFWEQAALDKIVRGVSFTDADYNELLQYLLEDAGLAELSGNRPQLSFSNGADTVAQVSDGQTRLVRIFNMQNVNALVPDQTLEFGEKLTAIFGATGAGKSGYARVLGCAGFTRGDKHVLPNVTQPTNADTILSADIEISDGVSSKVINYRIGNYCPELSQFYVFDSTSVHVHLTGSNTFSFSPAGLSYLTVLASVTDKVRERLKSKIDECNKPHTFGTLFQGTSVVTELVSELGPDTNLEELKSIATVEPKAEKRIEEIEILIAQLKTQDIPKQLAKLDQTINDLINLTERLQEIQKRLNDDAMSSIRKATEVYRERELIAQQFSVDQFKTEYFTQIGSEVWHRFIEAAKALAEAEQPPDKPYPQFDDHCLLCHQPLSREAHQLLLRLWVFLKSDAQAKLGEAQAKLKKNQSELDDINLAFFDDQWVSYRHLQEHDTKLLEQVKELIDICRRRREVFLRIINSYSQESMPQMPTNIVVLIHEVIKTLKARRDELEKEDPSQKIAELEKELGGLHHRLLLDKHFPEIADHIRKCVWARQADKIGGSTRQITSKYKELFGRLVTDRYIHIFEGILKVLKRSIKVKVETTGRKGETYKQIILETDPAAAVAGATTDRVLSEGEKRAVALADFLTEVTLDMDSRGIIMDDPVTSLDLDWKEKIASILVSQACSRQVIVFTHDLPFLSFLTKYASELKVKIDTHWIIRGDYDDKPGYVYLNNSPALERDYRKAAKAREFYNLAKGKPPAEQENLLHLGFGALRTAYEAFIIFDLFKEVVMRFNERVSFGRLKDIVWDKSIAEEVISKCELLSRYIEGHLHSDTLAAKPTCELLIQEIEEFDALRKRQNKLKS